MEYGLQLNVGDKFLVNVDEPVNGGMWKHRYNGHWLRVEKLCPPEKQYPREAYPALAAETTAIAGHLKPKNKPLFVTC